MSQLKGKKKYGNKLHNFIISLRIYFRIGIPETKQRVAL